MIIASDNSNQGTGMEPVSYGDIIFVERLIHNCTLDEETKTRMESRLGNVEFKEELYDMISILKENQRKNLNEEFDDALRRAI